MVKLFRIYDKKTGEEIGVSYSDKDGNIKLSNNDWKAEEIQESQKEEYMSLKKQQQDAKPKTKTKLEELEERIVALEKK